MVIYSKFLKKPIVLERISLLALAPVALTSPTPNISLEPIQSVGSGIIEGVTTIGEIGLKGLELLGKLAEYIASPATLLIDMWNGVHYISYPILLAIAMFSLFMYMMGHKSFAKYIPTSLVIFTFIQAVGRF